MFDLQFNRANEVSLARFYGHVSTKDLAEFEVTAMLLNAVEVPSDCIYDFTEVEEFDVTIREMAGWAQRPQPWPGRRYVFVTSRSEVKALARLFAAYQDVLGGEVPAIVDDLDEALALLRCPQGGFRPIERNWLRASICTEESAFVH